MTEATHPPAQAMPQARGDQLAVQAVDDPEAVARLYAAHASQLYRYFWIHTRSQAQAEDLVSETFLRALHSLPGYRPQRGTFSAWLYGIARHALAQQVKQRVRSASVATDLTTSSTAHPRAPLVGPDERIDLWQAVAELPEGEQEVLALKFGAGLTHPEIGRIMQLRTGYVGVLLYRALQRLRARLDEGGDGDAE